jgi:hypothetical protein
MLLCQPLDAGAPNVTRLREPLAVVVLASLLAVACTWPLAARLGSMGRVDSGDGRWSIWVVSWVAHALSTDPGSLYEANIFYPEHDTLAYSEANIGAGLLGLPVWLATRNPFATHNAAVVLSFVLSTITMYALARRLSGSRGAAAVAAVLFAYCPFVFARTAHIQLLLVWGLPLILLCLHHLVDRPSVGGAVALGLALAAQALSCAYYGILGALIVSFAVLGFSVSRGLWRSVEWWGQVALAAVVSGVVTLPFFLPYLDHQEATGFARRLDDLLRYSANWQAWLASSAWAHRWMHPLVRGWNEVLFPGLLATGLGVSGIFLGLRRQWPGPTHQSTPPAPRDVVVFYAVLLVVIVWLSFGPPAGLYSILWHYVPIFSFLRAPARFGIGAAVALAVLAAIAVAWALRRWPRARALPWVLAVVAVAELFTGPLAQTRPEPFSRAYRMLSRMPRGAVLELPFFERRMDFHRHTEYMLASTVHWQPLVNGYSDYASPLWAQRALVLRQFPAGGAEDLARTLRVKYVVLHERSFSRLELAIVRERFAAMRDRLPLLIADEGVELYLFTPDH